MVGARQTNKQNNTSPLQLIFLFRGALYWKAEGAIFVVVVLFVFVNRKPTHKYQRGARHIKR